MIRRDSLGRFTTGNGEGRAHRFKPGRSGNPAGRPPKLETCLRALIKSAPTDQDLRDLIDDPRRRDNERWAARHLLTDRHVHHSIAGADPVETRRLYRVWFRKPMGTCVCIFVDPAEAPERREAARRRIFAAWYRGWCKSERRLLRRLNRSAPEYRPPWRKGLDGRLVITGGDRPAEQELGSSRKARADW